MDHKLRSQRGTLALYRMASFSFLGNDIKCCVCVCVCVFTPLSRLSLSLRSKEKKNIPTCMHVQYLAR